MAFSRYAELAARKQELVAEINAINHAWDQLGMFSRAGPSVTNWHRACGELYAVEDELRAMEAAAPLRVVPREGERW